MGVGASEAALGDELGGGEGRLGAVGVGVALVGRDVRHVPTVTVLWLLSLPLPLPLPIYTRRKK